MNSGLVGALGAAPLRVTGMTRRIAASGPNAGTNALQLQATGGGVNVDLVLSPKGTGALILGHVPDGISSALIPTGGNKRGIYAVDLQLAPLGGGVSQTRVASGEASFCAGISNTASGQYAAAIGGFCTASGQYAVALGNSIASGTNSFSAGTSTALGFRCVAMGLSTIASADDAAALNRQTRATAMAAFSHGELSLADRHAMRSTAGGQFSALGDAQSVEFTARNKTTTGSSVELFLNGSNARLTIPSGKIFSGTVNIVGVKSDGSAVASYLRQVTVKNVAGTTSLVGSVIALGTDEATGTSISITADDTNDALKIEVTGISSETWRWVATIRGVEVAYGT